MSDLPSTILKPIANMFDRLISAGVAIILGFLVWLYARSRDQEMLDNVPIPVQIVLAPSQADHYDLEVTGPSQITASFSGPPSRIRELRGLLQRGEMRVEITLTVPQDRLEEARYLDTVMVDPADLHPPPGVRAILPEGRNRIPVTLRRIIERKLDVRLDYVQEGRVAQVALEPSSVLVRGPQEILERVKSLPTQPYLGPGRADPAGWKEHVVTGTVPLVQELEGRPIRTTPETVSVRLTLQPRQRQYKVEVPVQFLCPPNFSLRPNWHPDERAGRITVQLLGPAGEDQPPVTAYIELTGRKLEPGLYTEEMVRLQLPKDFQLDQPPPRSAPYRLSRIADEVPALGGNRNP